MTLVILVHVNNFCTMYPVARQLLPPITMPAFLIVTGYLMNVNKSAREFATYITGIFIPYVVVVTGFAVLSYYLPTADKISELTVRAVLYKVFVTSIGPYWFLQTMMVCGILYYACFRLLRSRMQLVPVLCVFYVSLVLVADATHTISLKTIPYFFLGAALRQANVGFTQFFRKTPLTILPFTILLLHENMRDYGSTAIPLVAYCTISFLGWLNDYASRCSFYHHILFVGANTLPIYLFHPVFTMLAKFYLPFFAFDHTGLLHALTTVVLATAGSLALAYAMDRTHLTRLFGRPAMLR